MKWFKHDSNAHSDAKLQRLRMKYGMEGFGLYWYLLELIAANVEKHNLSFELEHDPEVISANTGINSELVHEIVLYMIELKLFENIESKIFCSKMATRTDEYIQKVIRQQSKSSLSKNVNSDSAIKNVNPDKIGTKSELIEENRTEKNKLEKKRKEKYMSSSQAHSTSLHGYAVNQDINLIFTRWQTIMNHSRAKLDANRRSVIEKALKSYSVEELIKAIKGCAATPHNMGQNENGVVYDGLDLIFRDAEHIERFIRHCDAPPCPHNRKQNEQDKLKDQIRTNMEAAR